MCGKILTVACLWVASGCVGPRHHVRGRHQPHRHYHHHYNLVDAVADVTVGAIEGAMVLGSVISGVTVDTAMPLAVPAPSPRPRPPELERPVSAQVMGRIVWQAHPGALGTLRLGLRPLGGGSMLGAIESDPSGRFVFPVPPMGSYSLFVREPGFRGEAAFSSDGRSGGVLELPVSVVEESALPAVP